MASFRSGAAEHIAKVTVRWPNGTEQQLAPPAVDQRYRLIQGETEWRLQPARLETLAIQPGAIDEAPPISQSRIPLSIRLPVPPLSQQVDGSHTAPIATEQRPVLVNLWASWCGPCLQELNDWTQRAEALRASGLEIVALAVNDQVGESHDDVIAPTDLLTRLKFPFAHGMATATTVKRLRRLHDGVFTTSVDLAIPASFLIDAQGRLAVIYRGPVPVDQLLRDVAELGRDEAQWMEYAQPFPGRWNVRGRPTGIRLKVARDLVQDGALDEAQQFVTTHRTTLTSEPEFPKLLVWLGDELVVARRDAEGLAHYRTALEIDPKNTLAMNNLAWKLATHPEAKVRDAAQAIHWAVEAVRQTKGQDPGVLDTLAASYAEAGRWDEAVRAADLAIRRAEAAKLAGLAQRIGQRRKLYQQHQAFREAITPESPSPSPR